MGEAFIVSRVKVAASACQDGGDEVQFVQEGEGRDPAKKEPEHHDDQRDSNFSDLNHFGDNR